MRRSALILTYHAVESGPAPLCVDTALFREHLDVLADAGAQTLTVSELASALERDALPERAVAISFDDGFASVAENAAPLLAERGQRATVYCVAGWLGGVNDWPSQHPSAPRRRLATASQARELAGAGFEIGCHTMSHAPLSHVAPDALARELIDSADALEQAVAAPVNSIAYPYGVAPPPPGLVLVARRYETACGGRMALLSAAGSPLDLPRVDAHYLRRTALLRTAVTGLGRPYLSLRRGGAWIRRRLVTDYATSAAS